MVKHLIVLVGLPGSGKSTACKMYPDYLRISQDDMGKEGHMKAFTEGLKDGKSLIIDRCNFNLSQRSRYLRPAKEAGYRTTIIWFSTDAKTCIERISQREDHPNLSKDKGNIADVVNMFDNMFVNPESWEADDLVYK